MGSRITLRLKASEPVYVAVADSTDQDQFAQNVQSDLENSLHASSLPCLAKTICYWLTFGCSFLIKTNNFMNSEH